MGYVRTPEELVAIQRGYHAPRFPGRRLTVEFLTDPDVFRRLLPPTMEPADEPVAVMGIGQWHSNCVGDYNGGSLSFAASHRGVPGAIAIAMWMDSEPAVHFGRDVFGEPKKLATSDLGVDGDRAWAWIERGGERIVELEAQLGADEGPSTAARVAYNIRSRPAADGFGLDGPAQITAATFTARIAERRTGTGRIVLRGTRLDPLDEIPVLEVRRAELQVHDLTADVAVVGEIPAEDYLPWHYGRVDDPLALDTVPVPS